MFNEASSKRFKKHSATHSNHKNSALFPQIAPAICWVGAKQTLDRQHSTFSALSFAMTTSHKLSALLLLLELMKLAPQFSDLRSRAMIIQMLRAF